MNAVEATVLCAVMGDVLNSNKHYNSERLYTVKN